MKKPNDHYMGVLLEEINDRLKGIEEGLEGLKSVPTDIRELTGRIDKMDNWQDVTKLVIKDQSSALTTMTGA